MALLLRIALRNLIAARRRSLLLGTAIAMVTGALVLLMALSQGITDNLVTAATTMSAGHVNVAGFFKPTAGSAAPIVTGKAAVRAAVEAALPEVDYIVERHRGWGKIISETGTIQAGLSGLSAADQSRFFERLQLAKESEYVEGGRDEVVGDARELAQPGTVVLFGDQARRLGVRGGDTITVRTETMSGMTNTADARVVAVAKAMGLLSSFAVFVPRELVVELYQLNEDTTGALWVYLNDIDDAPEAMGKVRDGLAAAGFEVRDHEPNPFFFKMEAVAAEDWAGQQIDVTIWRDEVSFLTWVITGFNAVSWFVVNILGVIIAVGIMNAMWNAVRERTREIGTMRAIGMGRGQVLTLFMMEAFLLGLGATCAGALVGVGVALGLDAAQIHLPYDAIRAVFMSDTLHLAVSPFAVAASVLLFTVLTSLAALWPSIRAARLTPVKALAHAE